MGVRCAKWPQILDEAKRRGSREKLRSHSMGPPQELLHQLRAFEFYSLAAALSLLIPPADSPLTN